MKHLAFLMISMTFVACSESFLLGVETYEVGSCVEEVNKMYYTGYAKNKVYRIDSRTGNDYYLSMFQNKRWLDIRARNVTYFKPSKNFEYQPIACPGKKDVDRGIANKVKRIDGVKGKK